MSELFEALVLGIVQGLTEFLPVSSSGHLEIAKALLNDDSLAEQSLFTTVLLHFATALSTMVVFRKEIIRIIAGLFNSEMNEQKRFSFYVILSMIPAAIVGVFFEDIIENLFGNNLMLVGLMLLVTAGLLFLADRDYGEKKGLKQGLLLELGLRKRLRSCLVYLGLERLFQRH